jgi:hypothetical protein
MQQSLVARQDCGQDVKLPNRVVSSKSSPSPPRGADGGRGLLRAAGICSGASGLSILDQRSRASRRSSSSKYPRQSRGLLFAEPLKRLIRLVAADPSACKGRAFRPAAESPASLYLSDEAIALLGQPGAPDDYAFLNLKDHAFNLKVMFGFQGKDEPEPYARSNLVAHDRFPHTARSSCTDSCPRDAKRLVHRFLFTVTTRAPPYEVGYDRFSPSQGARGNEWR